mmetsp:Transcript_8801/g.11943  ORF Transcript_8801/g.11943 Transcript_8801/m.11943 type:complete len:209 (-) Transcript_8801:703-1329(-)
MKSKVRGPSCPCRRTPTVPSTSDAPHHHQRLLLPTPLLRHLPNLCQHALSGGVLLVALFEVERPVVQRLVVILLVHLRPHLVHLLAALAPIFIFLAEAHEHHRDGDRGILEHEVADLMPVLRINTLHTPHLHRRQRIIRKQEPRLLLRRHLLQFIHNRLQCLDSGLVCFDDHVELESVIFAAEETLLVLVLAHLLEGIVFGPRGDVHP